MILFKTIRGRNFRALFNLQSQSTCPKSPPVTTLISSNSSESLLPSSIYWRPFSLSAQIEKNYEEKSHDSREPLSVFFKEAVGLSERTENRGVEAEDDSGNANLKERLRKLEEELRILSKKWRGEGTPLKLHSEKRDWIMQNGAKRTLWQLFADDKEAEGLKSVDRTDFGNEDPMVHKELSPDMQMLTHHLYVEGYLKDANFMNKSRFDIACFEASYARDFLKFAAVKFGIDHQEIAKWLSASDLKKIALFGCPSLGRRSVTAAKHMRRFFGIEEHEVCQKCTLKSSCKLANKQRIRFGSDKLQLGPVMRVLVMYSMESVPQQLAVPEEIKVSVSRLLKEIVRLSETVS